MKSRSIPALLIALCAASTNQTAQADAKGESFIKAVQQRMAAAKSIEATLEMSFSSGSNKLRSNGKIQLMRPNLAKLSLSSPMNFVIVSNGTTLYNVNSDSKQYMESPADKGGDNIDRGMVFQVKLFFAPDWKILKDMVNAKGGAEALPDSMIDGVKVNVVRYSSSDKSKQLTLSVDKNYVPIQVELRSTEESETSVTISKLKNPVIDGPLRSELFAYKPPTGYALYKEPDYESGLLKVGTEAPAFELKNPKGGKNVVLAKELIGKKAVLLNFWFYG